MGQSTLIPIPNIEEYEPRLATIDDVDSIQKLCTTFTFLHKTALTQMIDKDRLFVIGDKNNIACVLVFNAYFNTISYLITHPQYRKKGLGKKLFIFGIDYHNINALIIKATYDPYSSIKFWESVGFIATNKFYITKGNKILLEMVWHRVKEYKLQL